MKEKLLLEDILNSLTRTDTKEVIEEITEKIKDFGSYTAVGIRLKEEEDYPYLSSSGYSKLFLKKENYICSPEENFNCLCRRVIEKTIDFSNTNEKGTFWTNNLSELIGSLNVEKEHLSGQCVVEKYKSMVLIPLKDEDTNYGLLQISDRRPNLFDEEKISYLESLANGVGSVLHQKYIEKELRERAEELTAIVEGSKNGVAVYECNKEGEFIFLNFNKSGEKIENIDRKDVLGKNVEMVFPGIKEMGLLDIFKRVLESGKPEEQNSKLYNNQKQVGWRTNFVYRISKNKIVSIYSDDTEQFKNQEKIFEAQKMDSIGTLIGGIVHDYNNLITASLGYSKLLMDKLDNSEYFKMAEAIHIASKRQKELTSKLLNYSRHSEVEMESVNLNNVVEDVSLLFGVGFKKISVISDLGIIDDINANYGQMNQILMNLLVNSKDAMNEKGIINIQTYMKDESVYLKVEDQGCGMNESTIQKVFDPYYSTKDKTESSGTGLGMSTVYNIIKKHDGEIEINSKENEGTTIEIKFNSNKKNDHV